MRSFCADVCTVVTTTAAIYWLALQKEFWNEGNKQEVFMFSSTWKSCCHLCRFIKKQHRTGRFNIRRGLRQVGSPMRGYGGSSLLEFTHNRWSFTQPWERGEGLFYFSFFQTEEVLHSFVYKHLLMHVSGLKAYDGSNAAASQVWTVKGPIFYLFSVFFIPINYQKKQKNSANSIFRSLFIASCYNWCFDEL